MTLQKTHSLKSARTRKFVAVWLSTCLLMVALIVVVGGLTRLTESGLSIVEWKPITGILPPTSDEAFSREFDEYKTSPQFQKTFPDMTLGEFRHIYWLEYIHRLLGRIAGIVFLLPLLALAALRALPAITLIKLAAIFALGGAQARIGWLMVSSGLIDNPHVSAYLLCLHLAMGFTLFGLILWQLLSFTHRERASGGFELPKPSALLKLIACIVLCEIFVQVMMGAVVAGLHAGLTFNTFPRMDGQWIPEGIWPFPGEPWYKNLFEDVTTAQFFHRLMAYNLTIVIPLFWLAGRSNPHVAHLLPILFSIFVVQFLLGVLTLLFVVPIPLASLHQANALLLFALAVSTAHRLFLPLPSISYEMHGRR